MRRAGLDADVLDEGCCGLAGNFGFERGHHELSMAIGEQGVLPAVRDAPRRDALVLADGFSCRTQIEQGGTGRGALHLAEALALGAGRARRPPTTRRRPPTGRRRRPRHARLVTAGAAAAARTGCRGQCGRVRRAPVPRRRTLTSPRPGPAGERKHPCR